MPLPQAVLDACVIVRAAPRDMLLRCAEAELYQPYWSGEILAEVKRNVEALITRAHARKALTGQAGMTSVGAQVDRLLAAVRGQFPTALIPDEIIGRYRPLATNHPKDRHVLAVAIAVRAQVIVTDNLKDFPQSALDPFGIQARSVDSFLSDLFALDPMTVYEQTRRRADELRKPPETLDQMLTSLARELPEFARCIRSFTPPP